MGKTLQIVKVTPSKCSATVHRTMHFGRMWRCVSTWRCMQRFEESIQGKGKDWSTRICMACTSLSTRISRRGTCREARRGSSAMRLPCWERLRSSCSMNPALGWIQSRRDFCGTRFWVWKNLLIKNVKFIVVFSEFSRHSWRHLDDPCDGRSWCAL